MTVVRCMAHEALIKNPGLAAPRHGTGETDEEFDARYVAYFSRKDIDGWEIRKGINDLQGMDLVPEPKICVEVIRACRRVNDFALAVRFLEAIRVKSGKSPHIYNYIIQEIKPVLEELGVPTLEEIGYDKPELALEDPYKM